MAVDLVGRVFVAVPVPTEIRYALTAHLADMPIPGKRVPPENWHITIRFLDVIDQVTYERFLAELDPIAETAFDLSLDGFGAFPNPSRATVFWAGVRRGGTELAVLNEEAEEAAQAAGLLAEERPFHPHLTLSRIRPHSDVRKLIDEDLSLSWRCQSLIVYRSILGRGGARYEPLDRLDLIG